MWEHQVYRWLLTLPASERQLQKLIFKNDRDINIVHCMALFRTHKGALQRKFTAMHSPHSRLHKRHEEQSRQETKTEWWMVQWALKREVINWRRQCCREGFWGQLEAWCGGYGGDVTRKSLIGKGFRSSEGCCWIPFPNLDPHGPDYAWGWGCNR